MAEFDLIRKLRKAIGPPGPGTLVGPGDDAAVYEPRSQLELLTCDAFVEGVHFRRDFATLTQIGAKCMVANVSDVAAMGGLPSRAVVSLCVPDDITEDEIGSLYEGMLAVCRRYGAELVGGDTVGSNGGLVVSVALTGWVDRDRAITRSGAVVGDALILTGEVGASEAGLRSLVEGLPDDASVRAARTRHLEPAPRVAEAQALMDVATPHAMIDISDGLSSDAWHVAEESGVGVVLYESRIPVSEDARRVAEAMGLEPLELALASGEEFELLVALSPSEVERTAEHVRAVTGVGMTAIGEVVDGREGCVVMRSDGVRSPLERTGYEHMSGRH